MVVGANDKRRDSLQLMLAGLGYHAVGARALQDAINQDYDCVFCDVETLAEVRTVAEAQSPVVAIITRDFQPLWLEAHRAGAWDVVPVPIDDESLEIVLEKVEQMARSRRVEADLDAEDTSPGTGDSENLFGMIGSSEPIRAVFRTVRKVAAYKTSVLITGESGTGKELVARALHALSPRAEGRFVAINCGAILPPLLESELFGHRQGAFTDAVRDKPGMFEEASGGTLFLDELGELPLDLQVKLLRAIQNEEVRRVGDTVVRPVDARIVAATARDLASDVATGRFREDLYYRLNVLPLALPPLRKRREDIPLLVEHFLRLCRAKHPRAPSIDAIADDAMELLLTYDWPGNVRELENAIERAYVLCEGTRIDADALQPQIRDTHDPIRAVLASGELSIKKTTRLIEQELIRRALDTTGGNRTNAAKILEISHRALLYKMKDYGIS